MDAKDDFTPLATAAVRIVSLVNKARGNDERGRRIWWEKNVLHKVPIPGLPWMDRL